MNHVNKYIVGPYQLSFDITNKCNLSCFHCNNASGENEERNQELTDEEVIEFIKSLLPMKLLHLSFGGGETLLRKELICECSRILSNNGIRTAMSTNGILATEEVIRDLYFSGIQKIQFSIDGCKDETHDCLRNQQGVYEKVIKALNIVRYYDMEICISFTPTPFNGNEFEDLHRYLKSLSYKNKVELRVQPLMPFTRKYEDMQEICPTGEQYRRLVAKINQLNHQSPQVKVTWEDPIESLIRFPNFENFSMQNLGVRANGNIVMSPYLPLAIGNIRKHTFEEYWEGGLNSIWKQKIPRYLASFVKCMDDLTSLRDKISTTCKGDIYIDLLEEDLNDMNVLQSKGVAL